MSFVRILKLNPLNAFQIRTLYRNLVSGNSDNYDQPDIKLVTQIRKIKNFNSSCKDSYTCIQVDCKLNCEGSKKPLAFINKTTGTFTCPSCEFNENLSTIFPLYDNQSGSAVKSSLLQALKLKANDAKNQGSYTPKDHPILINALPEHFSKLKLSISELVLNNLNATFDAEQSSWHFPLKNAADVVVGEKVLRLNGKEITFPPDCSSGILKYSHSQKECTKAVVVLNVVDFLALCSQKLDAVDVICLPHWLKTLPQQCLPNFEFYKQLILWFDFDNAGWDATRYFARKLDERRCLFIRPTDEQPTPFTAINQKLNLKSIIAKAQPILHKSITTFSALKQDVLCELQNVEKVNGVKWKRFPVLNKLLKGHRKGELTILTGPTGCGKTTFMSEYSLDLAMQGVSTLWGSFEIRNTRLAATIMRQFVGYPLDDKLEEFEHWAKQIEQLPMYYMTFHGQQSIKVVMEAIEHAQYVHDIQHVIIDNVQFMLGISSSSRQDKFWEQDTVIAAFRTFATKRNVHVTLVMHPRKEKDTDDLTTSSIFGSAKATQEADNVYIIQDKRLTSIRGRKFLQVAKNRYSGDLGMMPLEFNKDGLSYAPKKTKSSI